MTVVALELHHFVLVPKTFEADRAGMIDVESQIRVRYALHAIENVDPALSPSSSLHDFARDQQRDVAHDAPSDHADRFQAKGCYGDKLAFILRIHEEKAS